jgi:hypothetical protein
MGDFREEAGNKWREGSGANDEKAKEQPALEPLSMVGEDVAKNEVITFAA